MVSSSFGPPWHTCFSTPPTTTATTAATTTTTVTTISRHPFNHISNSSQPLKRNWFEKSVLPLAASMTVLLSSYPADAGILSGFSGLESIPGPELPKIDSFTRFNEENQKRYAENDARFKESPLLKELLEKSKLNKEKNRQAIQDKYCIRGAEWGVGDCSAEGMSPQEKDEFIAMLKKKAGVE
ncbi:uncharacterized protein LOC112523417 [Cynara cardunculus var. scolymus]|uniref:uncharacterized protein LOC112523417 n=1 Tax=Cynara cardunculus var. scolymus TaxID=59895 RepID=UPI000D627F6F|nr:uncharacterized protein LOC112523417 [Cynara cardunculus var. scolymus]